MCMVIIVSTFILVLQRIFTLFGYLLVILVFECILTSGYSFNVCTHAEIEHVNYNCNKMATGKVSWSVLPAFYTCRVLNG